MSRSKTDLRQDKGAAAIEMALLAPLLFIVLFGIIGFGIAFMQLQSIRGGVREGARASAVGATSTQVQNKVLDSGIGSLPSGTTLNLTNATCAGGVGSDTTVALNWNGNGIDVPIPFLPNITLHPNVSSTFQCEVATP